MFEFQRAQNAVVKRGGLKPRNWGVGKKVKRKRDRSPATTPTHGGWGAGSTCPTGDGRAAPRPAADSVRWTGRARPARG